MLWIAIGLVMIGVASFFEQGGWLSAVRFPLSLLTFMVLVVIATDLLLGIIKRRKPGLAWYVMVAMSGLLMGLLSLVGNPLPLVLLACLITATSLIVGFLKSALSRWDLDRHIPQGVPGMQEIAADGACADYFTFLLLRRRCGSTRGFTSCQRVFPN